MPTSSRDPGESELCARVDILRPALPAATLPGFLPRLAPPIPGCRITGEAA